MGPVLPHSLLCPSLPFFFAPNDLICDEFRSRHHVPAFPLSTGLWANAVQCASYSHPVHAPSHFVATSCDLCITELFP